MSARALRWQPRDLKPGDLIRVRAGSLRHYGVFVSEAEVIQFGPPPGVRPPDEAEITVIATDIDAFAGGQIVEAAVTGRKRLPPEKSIALARARLGEKGYSLLHNNCEHFVTECVLGERRCDEADAARSRWRKLLSRNAAEKETVDE